MDDLLPWSLSWGELERAARFAALNHYSRLLPYDDRLAAARDAIVDELMESLLPLAWRDLVNTGLVGINVAVDAERHHHGITRQGPRDGLRWAIYWRSPPGIPFAECVEDRLASHQVWAALSERDRETLAALGDYGDNPAAARALGLTMKVYENRLARGRRRARALWFDGEADPGHYSHTGRRGPGWDYTRALRERVQQRRRKQRKAAS